jgi:uncharacterized protein YjbI with pentapeptide repeats
MSRGHFLSLDETAVLIKKKSSFIFFTTSSNNNIMPMFFVELFSHHNLMEMMTDWISFDDFVKVDSALCNKKDRNTFFKLFHERKVSFDGLAVVYKKDNWIWDTDKFLCSYPSEKYHTWLNKRKIFISNLVLTDQCIMSACAINLSKVKNIYVHYVSDANQSALRFILRKSGHELLSFRSWRMSDSFSLTLTLSKHCPNLTSCEIPHLVDSSARYVSNVMACCARLSVIKFSANVVDDSVIQHLTPNNFACLISVDFGNCTFSDESLMHLVRFGSSLRALYLKGCYLTDTGVLSSMAVHMENVTCLDVGFCSIVDDETLHNFGRYCHNLTVLSVAGADRITDCGIEWICKGCLRMRSLDISHCDRLTFESGISVVKYLTELHMIFFQRSVMMSFLDSNKMMFVLMHLFDNLTIFDTQNNVLGGWSHTAVAEVTTALVDKMFEQVSHPSDCVFRACVLKVTQLKELNFRRGVTSTSFTMLLAVKMHSLTSLDLSTCGDYTSDHILHDLSLGSTQLERLILRGCIYVTDEGLCALFKANTSLRALDICGTGITDWGVTELANNCKNLQLLDISMCSTVSDFGIDFLAPSCPNLTEVNLSGTCITQVSVDILKISCKFLFDVMCDITPTL